VKSEFHSERVHTIVVGGSQAGLAVGYHLAQQGRPFLILDANQRIGDAWRKRWDSLRLFTPARYDALPGMPFPARGDAFPTKDEMADYLEAYANRFHLPVRTGVRVDGLTREGDRYIVTSEDLRFEAENVVVAMANYQKPRVPEFASGLDAGIVQLHSNDYRNPSQLREGGVLIVGAGNSAADIAMEVARTHSTWLAGKESGHIPYRIESFLGRHFFVRLLRFFGHRVLTVSTPLGRKVRPQLLHRPAPLIRINPNDLIAAGINRVPRVVSALRGKPLLADGRVLDVNNVIWCTGFDPGHSWIRLPIFDDIGDPVHDRGIVTSETGLYFVGLQFLYSMTSATVGGVGRDAKRVVRAIEARRLTRGSESQPRIQPHEIERLQNQASARS
jgi:putative flavoprotein involved in K+ transport